MSKKHKTDEKNKILSKQWDADKNKPEKSHAMPSSLQQGLNAPNITHLQQTVGNNAVQALLAQRKEASGPSPLEDDVADSIRTEKGGGQQLEEHVADKAGDVMRQDFSNVNVHTDGQADNLSRSIGAKAFTTGKDIFFKEGEYKPHTEDGQKLISHELTHVVQQGSGKSSPSVQGKMTVNDPNDKYEKEADDVADKVVKSQAAPVQAQESEGQAQRAEEEEEVAAKRDDAVQRVEEEEEVAAKRDDTVQRVEEEEEVAAKLEVQRQESEEEEMA